MALIKCKECGHEVSDKASACPHCGCPVEVGQAQSREQIKSSKKKRWVAIGITGIVVVVIAATFLYKAISAGGIVNVTSLLSGEKESTEIIITPEFSEAIRKYDQLEAFHNGMAAVGKNGKWGYINHRGEEVIPCQFDSEKEYYSEDYSYGVSHPFSEDLAVVRLNGKWGVIDKKGNVVVHYGKYEGIYDCHDGMLLVWSEGKRYMLNKRGEMAFDISEYEECHSFNEGLCFVKKDGKYGYIDTNGNLVIPCEYTSANSFMEGKAIVNYSERGFTCIDKQGNVLYTKENLQVVWEGGYRDGMLAVYETEEYDCKYGFLDDKGEMAIPCFFGGKEGLSYDNIEQGLFDFSEGYTCIEKYDYDDDGNSKLVTTFIDKQGNKKTFPYTPYGGDYRDYRVFSEGLACVIDNNEKVGFMDKDGKLVIPFKYDTRLYYGEGASVEQYGIFNEGVALVRMGDRWGYVDKNGNDTFTAADAEAWEAKVKREKEDQRQREEQARQEEERRRREGVEKVVSITIERDNRSIVNYSGNYGATKYSGMWEYFDYAITNFIRIPNGKVWIFKRTKVSESGLWRLRLFYYPKERGNSGVNSFDDAYKLPGNPPVLRAGDGFRIAAESLNEGVATVEVYFSEKDEEYYY